MSIQPQTKASEVNRYINTYNGILEPDNFKFKLWLRDAKALRSSRPDDSYLIESWVYRVQGKLNKALESAKKAYAIDKGLYDNLVNIHIALGNFDEAEELCLNALRKDSSDFTALNVLFMSCMTTLNKANIEEGLNIFRSTNSKTNERVDFIKKSIEDINITLDLLDEVDISVEVYKRVFEVGSKIKSYSYIGDSAVGITKQNNEVGNYLLVSESLYNVSIDDCLDLNDKLIDALLEEELPFLESSRIIYEFKPYIDIEESNPEYKELMEWV